MKRFFLGLLAALPVLGFAQTNFQKGYVVTNAKDTINGFVNYVERDLNPSSIVFKKELNGNQETYTLKNCAGYGINGIVAYQRFLVDISLNPVEVRELSNTVDTSSRRETVFLQELQDGKHVTLFSYSDHIKKRFYVLDKTEAVPAELIMQLYRKPNDPTTIITNIEYARQLLNLLRKYDKWTAVNEGKLAKVRYNNGDLLKAVSMINGQEVLQSKRVKISWFGGLSLELAKTKFSGNHELDPKFGGVSKTSLTPSLSGGFDVFMNPAIRKLGLRSELSINKSKSEVSGPFGFHSIDMFTATLKTGVLYHIYNTKQLKVYLNGGIGINYTNFSNQKSFMMTGQQTLFKADHTLKMSPLYLSFPINLGVVVSEKVEVLAGYALPTPMTAHSAFTMKREIFRFGLNYLFGKH